MPLTSDQYLRYARHLTLPEFGEGGQAKLLQSSVLLIGGVTFVLCLPAVHMGARLGSRLAHRAEFVGGLVLVALGANILIQHLRG